ncbi:GAF domain-containing protein [Streptomyces sp. NPDC101213]|uniref:GAF domain-containing protein n=1 Tax=Streptomyces sp. NPDC101213 TaxID=3366130 RepID=UPI0038103ADC
MTYTPGPSQPLNHGPAPSLPIRSEVMVPRSRIPHSEQDTVSALHAQEAAEQAERDNLIRQLGIPTGAHELFDEYAARMATDTGFAYGMVNLFLEEQTFIGLHNPPADSGYLIVPRTMSRAHGWCPEVVKRRKALPLHNVHASPRFSSNAVVDAVGIQSYFGAPLLHESGTVLGTVCVIDPSTRPLSDARRLRDIVLDTARQVMQEITTRQP